MIVDLRNSKAGHWLGDIAEEPAQFLISPDYELLGANMTAETIIKRGDAIKLEGGRVSSVKRALEPAMRELVAEASRRGHRTLIKCPDELGDVVWVASSRILNGSGLVAQTLLVTLRPLVKGDPLPGKDVATMFGLTPAEARLAVALAAGWSLAEIAEERGLHITTLRAQLRSIYAKVGVSKQSEFVSAVWRAAAV